MSFPRTASEMLQVLVLSSLLLGTAAGGARVTKFKVVEGAYDPSQYGDPKTGYPSIFEGTLKYKGELVGQVDWTGIVIKDINKDGGFQIYNVVWTFTKQSKDKVIKVGSITAVGPGKRIVGTKVIPNQLNVVGGFGAYETVIGGVIVLAPGANNDTFVDDIKLYWL